MIKIISLHFKPADVIFATPKSVLASDLSYFFNKHLREKPNEWAYVR